MLYIKSIEEQVNALLKHSRRNDQTIFSIEILDGYTCEFATAAGQLVFANVSPDGHTYITCASIAYQQRNKRYAKK